MPTERETPSHSGESETESEIRDLLAPVGITVQSVADFPDAHEVDETGSTFAENAALKVRVGELEEMIAAVQHAAGNCICVLCVESRAIRARKEQEASNAR